MPDNLLNLLRAKQGIVPPENQDDVSIDPTNALTSYLKNQGVSPFTPGPAAGLIAKYGAGLSRGNDSGVISGDVGGANLQPSQMTQEQLSAVQNPVIADSDSDENDEEQTSKSRPSRQPAAQTEPHEAPNRQPDKTGAAPEATPDYDTKQDLLNAQQTVNKNQLLTNMLRAGTQLGSALSRTRPDFSMADVLSGESNKPLDQYNQQQAQQLGDIKTQLAKNQLVDDKALGDPTSAISIATRQALAKIGFNVPEGTTASQLKNQGVNISSILDAQQNAQAKKAQIEMMQGYKNEQLAMGKERLANATDRMNNQIVGKVISYPAVAQRVKQIQNLDTAAAMLNTQLVPGENGTVTPQQIRDAQATMLTNLGIGGTSGVEERKHRLNDTLGMRAGDLFTFLTGDPQTLSGNSNLVKMIQNGIETEKSNAQKQLESTLTKLPAAYGSFYKKHPEMLADLKSGVTGFSQGLSGVETRSPSNLNVPPAPPGEINVINTSTGKTGSIPMGNLQQALQSGQYQVMK